MHVLEVKPRMGVPWKISGTSARWLLANRNFTEDNPRMSESEALTFRHRAGMVVLYGVLQLFCSLLGILWCVALGYMPENAIPVGHGLVIIMALFGARFANQRRCCKLKTSVEVAGAVMSGACILVGPLFWRLSFSFRGWHWTTGASVWKWGGTAGAILFYDNPVRNGALAFGAGLVADVIVMVACREWVWNPVEDTTHFAFTMISVFISYAIFPLLMTVGFRRSCANHQAWAAAGAEQERRLGTFRGSSRFLIFSLIPPVRATKLSHAAPDTWHRTAHDHFHNCTLVQMDVSGFTAMSARLSSSELVDLIDALFSAVEYAAHCIGNVWMVELIGDCAKFVVGGPYPCDDHAQRGAVLGQSILHLCSRLARRLRFPLSVRVGLHTGSVTAAVTGTSMPRYLLYGRDMEVLGKLEANANTNQMLASAAAATALGDAWPLQHDKIVLLRDGSTVTGRWCSDEDAMVRARQSASAAMPSLALLLETFAAPETSTDDEEEEAEIAEERGEEQGHQVNGFEENGEEEQQRAVEVAAARCEEISISPISFEPVYTSSRWHLHLVSAISEISQHTQTLPVAPTSWGRTQHMMRRCSLELAEMQSVGRTASQESREGSERMSRGRGDESERLSRGRAVSADLATVTLAPRDSAMLDRFTRSDSSNTNRWCCHGRGCALCSGSIRLLDSSPSPSAGLAMTISEETLPTEDSASSWIEADDGEEANIAQEATLDDAVHGTHHEDWSATHGATSVRFQRRVVLVFVGGAAAVSVLQALFLGALHITGELCSSGADGWPVVVVPAALALLLVGAMCLDACGRLHWEGGRPQMVATVLLVATALVLEGTVTGRGPTRTAMLWASVAAFVPCSRSAVGSRKWHFASSLYWIFLFAVSAWEELSHPGGSEELASEVEWWRDVLLAINFWVAGGLIFVPMTLAARKIVQDQRRARRLLEHTRKQVIIEGRLLRALVPREVKERFLRGDKVIADRIQDGTVLFVYVAGYGDTLLRHGADRTIRWINAVFSSLDAAIARTSVIKVETFNDFLLVYSRTRHGHAGEALQLAADMLSGLRVPTPDGDATALLLGACSGDFTAGIIGSHTPRYSIFGDTVNTASRMASSSVPATADTPFVHLAESTKTQVDGNLVVKLHRRNPALSVHRRGSGMNIKGKGWMQTYCLTSDGKASRLTSGSSTTQVQVQVPEEEELTPPWTVPSCASSELILSP